MQQPPQNQPSGGWNNPAALEMAFQEYEHLMEGTDKISDRRQTVNTEFVSINALFLTGVGYLLLQLFQNAAQAYWFILGFILIALIMWRINSTWLKLSDSYSRLINLRIRYMKELESHLRDGGVFPTVEVPLLDNEVVSPGQKQETARGTYTVEDVLFKNPEATRGTFGFSLAERHVAHTFIRAYWLAVLLALIFTGLVIAQHHFGFTIPTPFF